MIRINLYGSPKPKRGRRSAITVSLPTEGPSIIVVILVLAAVVGGGSYWWYNRLTSQHEKIQSDLATADRRIKDLSVVKTRYEEKDKQMRALKSRFDVIDQLRANQAGPVRLLNTVSDTVNSSDAVWLNTMKDTGSTVELEGIALSNVALANLMSNFKKTGFFKNVELKETVQEDYKNLQAFSFTIVLAYDKASNKKS
jgi:type IV pilus assembly protein PilN